MIILNCCFNVIIPKFNAVYIYTGFFYTVFFCFGFLEFGAKNQMLLYVTKL